MFVEGAGFSTTGEGAGFSTTAGFEEAVTAGFDAATLGLVDAALWWWKNQANDTGESSKEERKATNRLVVQVQLSLEILDDLLELLNLSTELLRSCLCLVGPLGLGRNLLFQGLQGLSVTPRSAEV